METPDNVQLKTRDNTPVIISDFTEENIQGHYYETSTETWLPVTWGADGSFLLDGQEHQLDLVIENAEIHDTVGHA